MFHNEQTFFVNEQRYNVLGRLIGTTVLATQEGGALTQYLKLVFLSFACIQRIHAL